MTKIRHFGFYVDTSNYFYTRLEYRNVVFLNKKILVNNFFSNSSFFGCEILRLRIQTCFWILNKISVSGLFVPIRIFETTIHFYRKSMHDEL